MNETIKTDLSPQIQAKKLKQITLILQIPFERLVFSVVVNLVNNTLSTSS